MARIIHIEDELPWIELTRDALADYDVDSASSYAEALALIRGNKPYDLALVDLNLKRDNDGLGGEILDLLKAEYPATRRIVVTGRLPEGSLQRNIFERYGIEEIIIKGTLRLKDLRKVVAAALNAEGNAVAEEVKAPKSDVKMRFFAWQEHLESEIRTKVIDAREAARYAGQGSGRAERDARRALESWTGLQRRFQDESGRLEVVISDARTLAEVDSAGLLLDRTMAGFADSMRQIQA